MLPEAPSLSVGAGMRAGVPNMRLTTRNASDVVDGMDAATFLAGGLIVNPRLASKIAEASLAKILQDAQSVTSRCTRQIYVARSLGIQSLILVLAPASSVATLLDLLRSWCPKEIVGCLDDYLWMKEAMGIVVADPEQEGLARIAWSFLGAVCAPDAQTHQVMSSIAAFWERGLISGLGPKNWLADDYVACRAPPSDQLQDLLAHYLPEALACPGLGDTVFRWITRHFSSSSLSSYSTAFSDWSGVLAVLPGLVLTSMASSASSCVVVVSLPRVEHVTRLVQGFVDCMGVNGVSVGCVNHQGETADGRILVGTPDKVHSRVSNSGTTVRKVVLLETDVLLTSGFAQQVEALLSIPNIAVAVHAAVRSVAFDDIMTRFFPGSRFCPRSGLSLELVDLYSLSVPDEEHKVAEVYKTWNVLRFLAAKMQLAVYCNSPGSVRKVAKALQALGAAVHEHRSDMGADELEKSERGHQPYNLDLVVTDIHVPGSLMDVILYDHPSTAQEFVERVGAYRGKSRAKVVICFVSSAEEQQLLDSVAEQYQVSFRDMPEKLPRVHTESLSLFRGRGR